MLSIIPTVLFVISCPLSHSQATSEVIYGPSSPTKWQSWINTITNERTKDLKSIRYNGSIYQAIPLQWTQSSFIQPQMMGYDQYFYDINTHSYTYDKFLNDLQIRYGGIDSFLYWTTYSNLGIDDRNQFDLQLSIPGGIQAIKNIVNYMHNLNPPIQVLLPYTPWDTGTNYSGNSDYITLANLLAETGADGFNGDTMNTINENFYTYSVNKYNHPIAMCPEWGGDVNEMNYDTVSWAYWPFTNWQPNVGRWKWYDGRHMVYTTEKWVNNHTNDLQNSFFNGVGFNPFENVFGTWNTIIDRDAEAIRRVATILRFFGNKNNNPLLQNFTQSTDWLPFVPVIEDTKYWNDLFASSFIVNKGNDKQQILFLIVNRNNIDISDVSIVFNNTFTINSNQLHVFDCYYGKELTFSVTKQNTINVDIQIEGLGYGAILATMDTKTDNKYLNDFLNTMNTMTRKPLNSFSTKWTYLLQTMTPIEPTQLYSSTPTNMVSIPYGIFYFNDIGHQIAGGNNSLPQDVQYTFDFTPRFDHRQYMTMNKFYIDKYPVTCTEYKQYLTDSKYKPKDTYNYLRNWQYDSKTSTYAFPKGYDKKPVTYLSLNEARLYCQFYGKRLPHAYEMAYAGQGNTSYKYPWGNTQQMGTRFPQTMHGRNIQGPADVDAFVNGNSMFGVSDLIGNVWQYTDEFTDNHTRSVIVRGSANYRPIAPNGLDFYFYEAYQLNQHGKYFLFDDSFERAGTLGFRCAADAMQSNENKKPMFWYGNGNYCLNNVNNTLSNGLLCGKISTGLGRNDLTMYGNLDWIQFGANFNDKSEFKMIRKQTNEIYINNITSTSKVSIFDQSDLPRGFYWSDGANDMPVRNKDDASTSGVFIYDKGGVLEWNVNNLKGGNMYKLRVFVGVWYQRGEFNVELNIDGSTENIFSDSTIYAENQATTNVCYELIIDLSSISNNKVIKLFISWILSKGNGNITLQAITLEKLLQMQ